MILALALFTSFATSCRKAADETLEEETTAEGTSKTDEQLLAEYEEWEKTDFEPYEDWTEKQQTYYSSYDYDMSEEDYFNAYQPPEKETEEYIELKKALQKVIRYRGYTGDAKQIVIDTFHTLYNNYPIIKYF